VKRINADTSLLAKPVSAATCVMARATKLNGVIISSDEVGISGIKRAASLK